MGDGRVPTHHKAKLSPTLTCRLRWMVTLALVGCLTLWTLQIATPLSIGCTKRKPQKNEKRRSLSSWRCFVAAKRSILAESYGAQVRDDSESSPNETVWECDDKP